MRVPKRIPIAREAGYHTEHLGTYAGGLYMAFAFFLSPGQANPVAVLHLFDAKGRHRETWTWEGEGSEAEMLAELAALPKRRPGSIAIEPFVVVGFGAMEIGLVVEGSMARYGPYGLIFHPPWDGLYDT